MSNKLTRRGLAFATTVALALTGLVAAVPANAFTDGISISPAAGSTYESINQSGVVIRTDTNADTEGTIKYRVTSGNSNYDIDELYDLYLDGTLNFKAEQGTEDFTWNGVGSYDSEDVAYIVDRYEDDLCQTSIDVDLQGSTLVVTPTEGSLFGNEGDGDNALYHYADDVLYLSIWTEDDVNTDDIALTVRAFDDYLLDDNEVTSGEPVSSSASVKLYDARTITSTTTVVDATVGNPLVTKTVLNKPLINTWFVTELANESRVVGAHYANNSVTLDGAWDRVSPYYPQTDVAFQEDAANVEDGIELNFPLITYSDDNVSLFGNTSVNYSSRAWYQDQDTSVANEDFVRWLGNRSATSAVFAGSNAAVDDIYEYVTEGDNLVETGGINVELREGTASAVVSGQIIDGTLFTGEDDLAAANVRVRATFTVDNLVDEDSEITVTGVTGDAIEGEELVAYGRTDAKGQVSFTFANSGADTLDSVSVLFEVLNSAGVWVSGNGKDFAWADAVVDDFTVSDNETSASSVTLTYEAVDQFGKGISATGTDEDDVLQVTVTGLDDDENTLDKTALVPVTKSLVNGSASFTFANYAAVDSFVWVAGILHRSEFDKDDLSTLGDAQGYDPVGDSSDEVTRVWKNDATKAIESVENEYTNEVSYTEFRTGTYADDAFYAWLEDTVDNTEDSFGVYGGNDEDGERATIYGSVETANGNGAAYQAVTISSAGLYFTGYNVAGDYAAATGSFTVETDVDGNFEIEVYSHLENLTGKSITITSGGKSTTTLLKTYMNQDIDDEDYWNGSAWVDGSVISWNWVKMTGNMPGNNTQYQIKVTTKDVWGNILKDASLDVYQNGWADVGISREDDFDEEDNISIDTNSSGVASFNFAKGPFYANTGEDYGDEEAFMLAPGGNSGLVYLNLWGFDYDINGDGDTSDAGEFSTSNFSDDNYASDLGSTSKGISQLGASFKFGPQANATEAAKKGAVKVQAANVKGKTVRVYVSGKLVKTVVADKAIFKTRVKGVKAGDKRVTVKVGAKRMYSAFITVK
jgi:hypothetical protein